MKYLKRLTLMVLVGMFVCGFAYAQDKKAANSQQSKMGECNKEAGDKKGDERKKFMSSCLKKDKPMTQQEKMKACNKDAGDKKGDDRKKFMSECLKADKK
jgi:hypothetical protein